MTQNNLIAIQEKIGYKFNDEAILIQAFTRKSFSVEHPGWSDNEALEFVGDKVLDIIVVKRLTELYAVRRYTARIKLDAALSGKKLTTEDIEETTVYDFTRTEGEMTEIKKQIVQTSTLSTAIEQLGLENYLLMGRGDVMNGIEHQPHVKEDLFEAIVGAVALDSSWNFSVLEALLDRILDLDRLAKEGVEENIDYISLVNPGTTPSLAKPPSTASMRAMMKTPLSAGSIS